MFYTRVLHKLNITFLWTYQFEKAAAGAMLLFYACITHKVHIFSLFSLAFDHLDLLKVHLPFTFLRGRSRTCLTWMHMMMYLLWYCMHLLLVLVVLMQHELLTKSKSVFCCKSKHNILRPSFRSLQIFMCSAHLQKLLSIIRVYDIISMESKW